MEYREGGAASYTVEQQNLQNLADHLGASFAHFHSVSQRVKTVIVAVATHLH